VRRDGDGGSMARPFVVVHSGKTTMQRSGFALMSCSSVVRYFVFGGGELRGNLRKRSMTLKREVRRKRRVLGYEVVNIGSNIAARYSASIGDVHEEAMTVPGPGRCAAFLPSDLSSGGVSDDSGGMGVWMC